MLKALFDYADRHPEGSLTFLTVSFICIGGAAFAALALECSAAWHISLKAGLTSLAFLNWIALGALYMRPYEQTRPEPETYP